MSLVVTEPVAQAGAGWSAEIYPTSICLAVDPEEDALVDALDALLAPTQKRFWTVEHVYEDSAGWDVYVMTRNNT